MIQRENLGDIRQSAFCLYCGGKTNSTEHVPSKVFLDEPYPPGLPTIYCCNECNGDFSLDEEYVACWIECNIVGSVNLTELKRIKVRRILRKKPSLVIRLEKSKRSDQSGVFFNPEISRISNIILKLAKGHCLYELNIPQFEDPSSIQIGFLPMMSANEKTVFEDAAAYSIFPEVGSRASQLLLVTADGVKAPWTNVQQHRYRYLATIQEHVIIRIVLSEYLFAEIRWDS